MKLLVGDYDAEVATSASKAGSYGVCSKGESDPTETPNLFFSSM
jgi:hypothetical protein